MVSGRPREAPAYAGTDFIIARDGWIATVYLFFDKLPQTFKCLEGYRRKAAGGSWDVAQSSGSGKTQVTRQDRASRGLRNPKGRLRIANYERNSF